MNPLTAASDRVRSETARSPSRPAPHVLRALLRRVLGHRTVVLAAGVSLVLAALAVLGFGMALRALVDHGFASDVATLDRILLAMGGLVAVMSAAVAGRIYFVSWLGERLVADLRAQVFRRVFELPAERLEHERVGELVARLTADAAVLQTVIPTALTTALRNALLVIGGLAFMVWTSPRLSLVLLIGLPLVAGPVAWAARRVRMRSRNAQDAVARLSTYVDESLHGVETLKAFNQTDVRDAEHQARVEHARASAMRRNVWGAGLAGGAMAWMFVLVLVLLAFGGRLVAEGAMSPGALAAFLFYAVLVASAAATLGEQWAELARASGAAERLLDFAGDGPLPADPPSVRGLDAAPVAAPSPDAEMLRSPPVDIDPRRGLELRGVRFSYPGRDSPALALDALDVAPGEQVAIVGPSGAGKSTLFRLILGLRRPDAGTMHWQGVDLVACDPAWIRAQAAWVSQPPRLFSGTVLDNLRVGRADASEAECWAALEAANAAAFVRRLPGGLFAELGEGGQGLSGGQTARLALARAFLRDPRLLLLDEATSALDAESERAVQASIERLSAGRTTLVIAHRLATVRRADRIVVVDGGRIVAQGTHTELLSASPLYAHLARLQFLDGGAGSAADRLEGPFNRGELRTR